MDKTKEIYISIDIESDGPVPNPNSMLSLGAAAIGWKDEKWEVSHTFSANLTPLSDGHMDMNTWSAFWSKNPDAWAAATKDARTPYDVMQDFAQFLSRVRAYWNLRPVAVGAPAVFDLAFVRWYMIQFGGTDQPFGHSGYDTKSVAATLLKIPYPEAGKRNYPKEWFDNNHKHTHVAVEDAVEQAWIWSHIVDASPDTVKHKIPEAVRQAMETLKESRHKQSSRIRMK